MYSGVGIHFKNKIGSDNINNCVCFYDNPIYDKIILLQLIFKVL